VRTPGPRHSKTISANVLFITQLTLQRNTKFEFARIYYFLIFILTGFSALTYQIAWQRILTNFTGADALSVTLVVAAFMGGLGFGSLFGGYAADRVNHEKRLSLFALTQAGIACFAIISPWFYYDLLYLRFGFIAKYPALMILTLFVSLLWPTFLMGLSLPLLAKTLTHKIEKASEVTGYLYGFNTLGAALGAFITTWFVVRRVGLNGAILIGAILNFIAAIASMLFLKFFKNENPEPAFDSSVLTTNESQLLSVRTWILIYGISGFIALSLEIVWFRILGVMLKSTTFTFGHLLGIMLGAMAIGTLVGTWRVNRSQNAVRKFFAFQSAIIIYTTVFLIIFIAMSPNMKSFWNFFGRDDPLDMRTILQEGRSDFIRMYFVLALVFIGPPSFLMGISYPYLQKIVQQDLSALGRRVGLLQSVNILGSMCGAFVTGWILLSAVGVLVTLKILLCVSSVFFILLLYVRYPRASFAIAAFIIIPLIVLMPSSLNFWANLHGISAQKVITHEDNSGIALLKNESADFKGQTKIFVNGLGQSTVPFYDFHITLGMVPAMVHPAPQDIAIIGMGAGATLFAAGGRPETKSLTSIEIVKPLLLSLMDHEDRHSYPGLRSIFNDHRINYVFGDGRSVILNGDKKYDIIEADALRTTSAYSGNLFSVEYFQLLKNHVKPGGIAVTAAPTQRIINGFVKVFPYAVLLRTNDTLILGSTQRIDWDIEKISNRLRNPFTKKYYARVGVDVESLISIFSAHHEMFTPEFDREALKDYNTDLFPKDEFLVNR
jgi:spermidine synthase